AIAISPNGEYVAGWDDQPPFAANGWVVYFDGLLFEPPACSMECPADIAVIAPQGETSAVVSYEVPFTCGPNAPPRPGEHVVCQHLLQPGPLPDQRGTHGIGVSCVAARSPR
ncbi:MAG: hypothetical protein ACK6A5_14160, partial [Flavobacteriales bacterium]